MSIITHIIFVIGSATSTAALWFRQFLWEPSRSTSSQRDTADRPTPETPTTESEDVQEYRSRMTAMADAELRASRDAEEACERLRLVIREAGGIWSSQMCAMDDERLLEEHSYSQQQGRSAFATSPARIPVLRTQLAELVRHDKDNSTTMSRHAIRLLAAKIVFAQSLSDDQVELAIANRAAAQSLINFHGEDGPGPDPIGPVGAVGSSGSLPFHLDADAVARRDDDSSSSGDDPHVAFGFTMAAGTSTAYDPGTQVVRAGHNMPGMRLPRRDKTAFSSAELFEQQRDMQQHDHGLQSVLVALHVAVSRMIEEPVALVDYVFVMNFTQAASVTTKRYSVRMQHPIEEQLDLVQRMSEATMMTRWTIIRNGTEVFFDPYQDPEMVFQDGHRPAGREQRVITLDDEEDYE